jgi:tetratricopeptide (TPR) repeat protein
LSAVGLPVAEDLGRAEQALKQGRIEPAAALAEAHLQAHPGDTSALYLLAVCRRYQQRNDDAMRLLDALRQGEPGHARAAQEAGHNLRQAGRREEAVAAYRQAVASNPALQASWRALAELTDDSQARQQADFLQALPPALLSVTSQMYEGRLYRAEQLCRSFLQQHPHHPEAMRLLAALGLRLNVYDDAEFLLESCLELHPDFTRARLDYIEVLHRRQKFAAALAQAEQLYRSDPDNSAFESAFANASVAVGRYEQALAAYRRVIDRSPDSPGIHLACGHALKTIGSRAEAEEAYQSACRIKPDFGDAWWSLANLKTYRFSDAELACMEAQEAAPGTSLYDRFHLCFALGRAREQRAEHAQAFHWYDQGNRLKQTQTRYSADRFSAECDAQREHCSSGLFERRAGEGCPAADPIFIVGLPRAGSTLLEQILSSHSMVDGTFELPNVLALAHRLGGRRRMDQPSRYPAVLAELDAADLRQFGERYIEETRIYRQGAPMFTDKMPNNFRHIGLIHLILPNATIIDARRHPMACCFSAFKQLFAEGQEFTYGLENVGRYYRDYVELMDHWDRVLPGRILRVEYEELVSDFEAQVRRLLDHCGLPFEENCLAFHRTERSVRTASSEQVRRPLYDNALTEWRHYAPHLDPLRQALGPVLERYPT